MRNRAKCKLCKSVIESFHELDYVDCKCGEISIHGGNAKLGCSAKDFSNFMRVDDMDNEIVVKIKGDPTEEEQEEVKVPDGILGKVEKIKLLEEIINNIEKLPPNAMYTPINHYDFSSALMVILALFKSESD